MHTDIVHCAFQLEAAADQAVITALNDNTYNLYIADFFNNAPGAGTTIDFETTDDCGIVPSDTITAPNLGGRPGAFTTTFLVTFTGGDATHREKALTR